jgi:hypothetical protein
MLKIVGIQRKTGTYEGNKYDNIMIHCLENNPSTPTICGDVCQSIKIKSHLVHEVFGGLVNNDADFRDLLGCFIMPYYNQFKTCIKVEIIEKGGEK